MSQMDVMKHKHDAELKNQADLANKKNELLMQMNDNLREEMNSIRMMMFDDKMGIQPTARVDFSSQDQI